jgi:hypothetical protein
VRTCSRALLGLAAVFATHHAAADDKKACASSYEAGQALRDDGKLVDARSSLQVCVNECSRTLRRDCIDWLHAIEERIPTIVIRAEDESGSDLEDATVEIDGAARVPLNGRTMQLDPGPHRIRVWSLGTIVEERIVLAEGESVRTIVLRVPHATATQPAPEQVPASRPRRSTPPWVFALGGAGLVSIGAATYLYARGLSDGSELADRCGNPPTCPRSETDAAHDKLVVGDVLAGVGLLAIGVTLYLVFARSNDHAASVARPR